MDFRKNIFKLLGIILFIAIAIFSYYQYRFYRNGPEIENINIKDHMRIIEPSIEIKATLLNTKAVTLNGRVIKIIDNKKIEELVVFSPGDNIITIGLKDNFGNTKSYSYDIYYSVEDKHYKTLEEIKLDEKNNSEDLIINNNN